MRKLWLGALCAAGLLTAGPSQAVVLGQIDDFEDGTVENWLVSLLGFGGHPAPPVNVPTGGPAGVDDNFMLLSAFGGSGAGSRLSVINPAQWNGNYVAAGVTGININFRNFGDTDLSLRIVFEKVDAGPTDIAMTEAFLLPANSGWQNAFFSVRPEDLTAFFGSAENAVTDATVIRIIHGPNPEFPGPPVIASLGVDNIEAVPEPATLLAMLAGLGGLAAKRRRAA